MNSLLELMEPFFLGREDAFYDLPISEDYQDNPAYLHGRDSIPSKVVDMNINSE